MTIRRAVCCVVPSYVLLLADLKLITTKFGHPPVAGSKRDDVGRFEETVTEQEILKVFDYEYDPVLTAGEVADGLWRFGKQMTSEGVSPRLDTMAEDGLVSRKKHRARAGGWWAEVAPELDHESAEIVDSREGTTEWIEV